MLTGPSATELWQQMERLDALVAQVRGYSPQPPMPPQVAPASSRLVKYADPHACPDCRGWISGHTQCPHCGLALTGPGATELWRQMERLDALVAQARQTRPQPPATAVVAPTAPPASSAAAVPPQAPSPAASAPAAWAPPPAPPVAPTAPQASSLPPFPGSMPPQATAQEPRKGLDVGSVILALGALLLLVAATIFISVSWDRLGLFGRSMALFAATLVATAAAAFTTRRRLGASAEALWAVVFGLLTLDWFAARAEGLLGLDAIPGEIYVGGWAVVLAVLTIPLARTARGRLGRPLVLPQIYAGVAPWIAVPAVLVYLWSEADWTAFWSGAVAALLAALVLALAWRLRTTVALWIVVPVGVAMVPFLVVAALSEAFASPDLDGLVLEGHGAPLAVIAVGSGVAALIMPRGAAGAAAVTVMTAGILVVTAAAGEVSATVAAVVAAVFVALGSVLVRGASTWARGAQAALVAAAGGSMFVVLIGWSEATVSATAIASLSLGAAIAAWGARRRPTLALPSPLVRPLVLAIVVVGVLATMSATDLPEAVQAAVAIAGAALIAWRFVHGSQVEQWVGPAALLVALVPASGDDGVAAWAYAAVAVAFGVLTATTRWDLVGAVSGVLTALTGAVAGVALANSAGLDTRAVSLWLTLAGVAAFGVASWFVESLVRRIPLEVVAAVLAFAGVLAGLDVRDASWMALLFLVLALSLFAAAADVADRRWFAVPAIVLAVLAWICFIVGEEVTAVEAFTVPLAAVALGIGAWFMARDASVRSVPALGVGLALAVLPSLPQALADPTSLRAILLGGAAVVALTVGWWRSWQAPFLVGALVLALLVVVNLWPLAMAVQRWALFGVLGVVLLVIGVTWESRVRQGRAALRVVGSMR
ncbi:SCO7613 C-terminal domain-containing membrane protein [Aeromicrobium camelliae]|uniref:SCO7613 C-terminal domain-containing membrane protein n=1 Tax=Aeromicrobium camelliae TaxID=1538144 RepID=UPI0014079796|nr:hypothetical protein [Aeromicrobium camelliae]